jgi:hypothetical protein
VLLPTPCDVPQVKTQVLKSTPLLLLRAGGPRRCLLPFPPPLPFRAGGGCWGRGALDGESGKSLLPAERRRLPLERPATCSFRTAVSN